MVCTVFILVRGAWQPGPAAAAGVAVGQRIVRVGGVAVESLADVLKVLETFKSAGDAAAVEFELLPE